MSDYYLRYEPLSDEVALLHCDVEKWSVSVAKRLDKSVSRLFWRLEQRGYTSAITVSPNDKFCEFFCGQKIGWMEWEGQDYGVYLWDLRPQQS
jgi:hypothetical protein